MSNIVIKNAWVIDGTGAKTFHADIAVEGEIIAAVGQVKQNQGKKVIDAQGLVVAPVL